MEEAGSLSSLVMQNQVLEASMKNVRIALATVSASLLLSQASFAVFPLRIALYNQSNDVVTGDIQSTDGAVNFDSQVQPHSYALDKTRHAVQPLSFIAVFTVPGEAPVSCSRTFLHANEQVSAMLSADAKSCVVRGSGL
jgi:hypothetical protein